MRFFGIDWLHIFRVSYNLQQGVDAMAKLVINDTSTTPFADILLPRYDNYFYLLPLPAAALSTSHCDYLL